MDDEDDTLASIRAKRMAQLQGLQGGAASTQSKAAHEEAKRAAEDQRAQILKALLAPSARERLANISMVKPEKARRIEDMLIMNAQRGAFSGQISEEQLIQMLESITEKTATTKVTIQRRRDIDDDW